MTRGSIRENVETVVVVTVITVLVWVYAENKNVKRYVDEPLRLKFVSSEGEGLTISPSSMAVKINFRGSTGQKQQFERIKQNGPIKIPVDGPAKNEASAQPVQVVLKDKLNDSPLGNAGIQVLDTNPSVAELSLRRMQDLRLPIKVETGQTAIRTPVKVEPQNVTARLPASLSRTAEGASVTAALDALDLSKVQANQPVVRQVPLTLPPRLQGQEIQIEPETAKVRFTVQKRTATTTLISVPIHINAPPSLLEGYEMKLPDDQLVLHNVKLTGPADLIHKIAGKKTKVWAELRPSSDQLVPGQTQLPVHITTPPGVRVVSQLNPVTVSVRRRSG